MQRRKNRKRSFSATAFFLSAVLAASSVMSAAASQETVGQAEGGSVPQEAVIQAEPGSASQEAVGQAEGGSAPQEAVIQAEGGSVPQEAVVQAEGDSTLLEAEQTEIEITQLEVPEDVGAVEEEDAVLNPEQDFSDIVDDSGWIDGIEILQGGDVPADEEVLLDVVEMEEGINLLANENSDPWNINEDGPVVINNSCSGNCSHVIIGNGSGTANAITVTGGTHNITIQNVNINALNGCAFSIGSGADVRLTLKGRNTLKSSSTNAGIQVPAGAELVITKESMGSLQASGGNYAAGIGGVCYGGGGTIIIEGGTVTAIGGNYAAGIGSSAYGDPGCKITIKGGIVHASGGGAGIGGGSGSEPGSFSTDMSGSAVIFTDSISDQSKSEEWNGIIFLRSAGQVYAANNEKTLIIDADFEIPGGKVLTIPEDVTLVNKGAITGDGEIIVKGNLQGTGTTGNVTITRPDEGSTTPDCDISKEGKDIGEIIASEGTAKIKTGGNYYLSENLNMDSPLVIEGQEGVGADKLVVNLCLHGCSLSSKREGVILVQDATLNLYDCQGTGKITGGYAGGKWNNEVSVRMQGGGIHARRAAVNLYGGSITGNTAADPEYIGSGGGIALEKSELTIHDGAVISYNNGTAGGVYVNFSTVEMQGGLITGNKSTGTGGPAGGGVGLSDGSQFCMNGGEISKNSASAGGGIYIYYTKENAPTLILTGGRITENTITGTVEAGGGIYFGQFAKNAVVYLNGSPFIYGNKDGNGGDSNISNQRIDQVYELTGLLKEDSKIGFAFSSMVGKQLVTGWKQYMEGKTIEDYFVCDREDIGLKLDENGEIMMTQLFFITKADSEHGSFTLEVNGNPVERACEGDIVTVVPQPDEGYILDIVSVKSTHGTGTVPVNGTQFTMPGVSGGVTVSVTFKQKSYAVDFDSQGGTAVESQTVMHGETAAQPEKPTRTGYTFGGWYTEKECQNAYEFSIPVTGEVTLYAKWEELKQPEKPMQPEEPTQPEEPIQPVNIKVTAKAGKTSIKLTWDKAEGADGYEIYGAECGKKFKLLKSTGSDKTGWTHKKLKSGTFYKYYVSAYQMKDGKKTVISDTLKIHVVTDGSRFGNAKKVTVNKKKLSMKAGKTETLKAAVKLDKAKDRKHVAAVRYFSTNKKVASVNRKGVIKGKAKGTCYVYCIAQNGVNKRVKVTVK